MISSEKIKLMRKLSNRTTQEAVGRCIGLERSTYARREAAGDFSTAELKAIAELLNCSVDDFYDNGEIKTQHTQCRDAENDARIQGMRETISVLREQIETQKEMIDMLKAQLSKKEAEDAESLITRRAN